MAQRGCGQIALLGSVAAFHDLPYAAAYAGSKAGLARFATSLRLGLRDHRVGVTLVSPGFVDTPMSRRLRCTKPFLLQPGAAAKRIALAISHDQSHLIIPWQFALIGWASCLLPPPVRRWVMRRTRVEQAPRAATLPR
jgi:short-subunit dehydrogenase